MKHFSLVVLISFLAASALAQLTQRDLPQRHLQVALRQVEESSGAVVISTQTRAAFETQQILVRNGSPASLSVGQSVPVQWVQAVWAWPSERGASAPMSPNPNQRIAGVAHQMTWLHAGQRLTVLPRWSGGKQPVTVEIELQSAQMDARTGPELPASSQSELRTTVSVPLDQWVTLAVTGQSTSGAMSGGVSGATYGSEAAAEPRRLLQLRVTAP